MHCTSANTVSLDERGEMMLLAFHQDTSHWRTRWRPVIYIGPADEPNQASELFLGEWRTSLRKAQVSGLAQYFDVYYERYGFAHPEDPKRKPELDDLPARVVVMTDQDAYFSSHVSDPDVPAKH